jgi:hypothetical protein
MDDEDRPVLHDPGLLAHFCSPGLLATPEARTQWVAPDRHALPALASWPMACR